MLSVDLPPGGMRPDATSCRLLEQFAVHAALAIEHARVHTFVADSERLFRAMFDRSPIAIALLTEDQRITRVNVAFEKLLGRRRRPSSSGPWRPSSPRPIPPPPGGAADAAASSGDPYEVHFARPDGSEVWGRVSSTGLAVGGRDRAALSCSPRSRTSRSCGRCRRASPTRPPTTGSPAWRTGRWCSTGWQRR